MGYEKRLPGIVVVDVGDVVVVTTGGKGDAVWHEGGDGRRIGDQQIATHRIETRILLSQVQDLHWREIGSISEADFSPLGSSEEVLHSFGFGQICSMSNLVYLT